MIKPLRIAGMMSGTSLDGLDIALVQFSYIQNHWSYTLIAAETIPYPAEWKERLENLLFADARTLAEAHAHYGRYLGETALHFLSSRGLTADLLASHGHTVFHQPSSGYTFQLGSGAHTAIASGIKTICDFRTSDVASGGQGAPLVPMGDLHLFSEYGACLNLGGFANISVNVHGRRIAWDIAPANMALNYLANQNGCSYDANGIMAAKGKPDQTLIDELLKLPYFLKSAPKSLGREWFENDFKPVLDRSPAGIEDKSASLCLLLARLIADISDKYSLKSILVTGGGAHHTFLMECIQRQCSAKIIIPDNQTIDFKEAIVFAFLGCLRILEIPNALGSVTGADHDTVGGAVYLP